MEDGSEIVHCVIRGCIMNIVLVSRVVLHIEDIGSECIQCTIAALYSMDGIKFTE